ncbi:MAG: SpoIIE family protein phosphatase, partial [Eubacteriales bacterium]
MSIYVETSAKSLKKYGEELCGDKVEMIRSNDKVTVVLADGLGSGVKANILATLTSKIAATMLSEGADIVEVVETIVSTLPVCKVREIAYSTFSILQVDNNGLARLVEFDNPEALLLRDGKEVKIEKKTMDVEGKMIRESNFTMKPGDACILFSDGAVHAGVGKLLNFGWQRANIVEYMDNYYKTDMPARQITSQLLSACNSLYTDQPGDDTTVVTVKVCLDKP